MSWLCLNSPPGPCRTGDGRYAGHRGLGSGFQPAAMPQAPRPASPRFGQPKPFRVGEYSKGPPTSHRSRPTSGGRCCAGLTNAPRLDQLLRNGKLMLSMNDAIALALENNLDIAISAYNLNIADTDLLRTKAGAPFWAPAASPLAGNPEPRPR